MNEKKHLSRREFLSYSAAAGVIGALGIPTILTSCSDKKADRAPLRSPEEVYIPDLMDKALDGKPLKAGVIGCGGRGSGAAKNLLTAADQVTITALGDVFPDRLEHLRGELQEQYNMTVAEENCFLGFDAYQKVIDSGVDVVIIATPPVFRPQHFKYATEKGVHSFLEKPIAVDPEGYRTIMATAKQARAQGLCVVTGTQRHHQRSYVESYKKIVLEGMIGEITGGNVYWNQSMLWYKNREKGWSDMEWMIRDWVNWKWLSGDHIVEQHVHNIDVFLWFSGYQPVSATSFGSRQRRLTGDQFDNFSTDFVCENGVHFHSMCRQIDGCANNVSEFIQGTRGSWTSGDGANGQCVIRDLQGNILWQYDPEAEKAQYQQTSPYVLEHVNWINGIRQGSPIVQAEETALSNMAAIMARESAYSGRTVTWDEMVAASLNYLPEDLRLGSVDFSLPLYQVPVPGTPKTNDR